MITKFFKNISKSINNSDDLIKRVKIRHQIELDELHYKHKIEINELRFKHMLALKKLRNLHVIELLQNNE